MGALIVGSFHGGWAMLTPLFENEERLRLAAFNGESETVTRLLKMSVNVNARDICDQTALMEASFGGHRDIVCMLLAEGADVNARGGVWGWTALINASCGGYSRIANTEIIRVLLDAGADVNARAGSGGSTALTYACGDAYIEIVRMLLDAGADVNIQAGTGWTSLMEVAIKPETSDSLMCATALIEANANIALKNKDGKTALDLARENNNVEIVKLLENIITDKTEIKKIVADKWPTCPLEVIEHYIMLSLNPDQK